MVTIKPRNSLFYGLTRESPQDQNFPEQGSSQQKNKEQSPQKEPATAPLSLQELESLVIALVEQPSTQDTLKKKGFTVTLTPPTRDQPLMVVLLDLKGTVIRQIGAQNIEQIKNLCSPHTSSGKIFDKKA